jgi:hypothetical protein
MLLIFEPPRKVTVHAQVALITGENAQSHYPTLMILDGRNFSATLSYQTAKCIGIAALL